MEAAVKIRLILLGLTLALPAFAAPAQDPKTTCLYVPNIEQTEILDNSTVLYHMRGHEVYRVKMLTPCFGLKDESDGFTYVQDSLSTENLCANQATIRLNSLHSICQLGDFTRVK